MTVLKLFLIYPIKDQKIGGKMDQFGGKSKKKVELRGAHGVRYFSSLQPLVLPGSAWYSLKLLSIYTFYRNKGSKEIN